MVKRNIKYPLIMKSGSVVRSLDELRANADVDSIMDHYYSGYLSNWCTNYNYNIIASKLEELKYSYVKSVLDKLGIDIPDEEITKYITNTFMKKTEFSDGSSDETIQAVYDDKTLKSKLAGLVSASIDLNDYAVQALPCEGCNEYKITAECHTSKLYTQFILPYDINEKYTKELFEKDLISKTANAINSMASADLYNKTQSCRQFDLNIGDTFKFGKYNNNDILWQVIDRTKNRILVISAEAICNRMFDSNEKEWPESELKKWLNGEFYNNAFSQQEKNKIGSLDSDKITLLNEEEFESMLNNLEQGPWWLQSGRPAIKKDIYASILQIKPNPMLLKNNPKIEVRPVLYFEY